MTRIAAVLLLVLTALTSSASITTLGVGTTASSEGGGDPGEGGDYAPFYAEAFGSGTLGQSALGPESQYSDDIAGPFGESRVVRFDVSAGNDDFGGTFSTGALPSFEAGDEVWIRIYHYFPTSFCSGYGAAGDGWGNTKWLRFQYGGGSSRLTMQLGQFGNQSCNSNGPAMWGATHEAMTSGTQNSGLTFNSVQTIPRNQWVALQWNIRFGTTAGTSHIRMWINDTYMGALTMNGSTLASSALSSFVYGDYWNGDSYQNNTWYISNVIMTKEQPDSVDSGGRPYIDPNDDAGAF